MSNNALIANLIKMTLKAQKEVIFSPKNMTRLITLVKRMQQSFRLMVGVPDYATYVSHMQEHWYLPHSQVRIRMRSPRALHGMIRKRIMAYGVFRICRSIPRILAENMTEM